MPTYKHNNAVQNSQVMVSATTTFYSSQNNSGD